ncbi:hypothetical protein Tco_1472575 [Tanacetum coccineum]
MTRECVSCIVDEVLAAGASCSMEVDKGVPIGLACLGAAAIGAGETTLYRGLKYLSNIGWNKISQSFFVGRTKSVREDGFYTNTELIVLVVIS